MREKGRGEEEARAWEGKEAEEEERRGGEERGSIGCCTLAHNVRIEAAFSH